MPIYYVNLDVQYIRPLDLVSARNRRRAKVVAGFLQEFGATYADVRELKQVIERTVLEDEGASNVTLVFERIVEIDESDLRKEVYGDADIADALLADPRSVGVWYRTGRAFYRDS